MPSRSESIRARERLQLAAPISDDASLLKLKNDVAEILREARRDDAIGTDKLVSTVIDMIARKYFQHILRRQARATARRTRA
jgi:hypothetical protein